MNEPKQTTKRVKCEIFMRCVGYYRPVSQFNKGKQSEATDRKMFSIANSFLK